MALATDSRAAEDAPARPRRKRLNLRDPQRFGTVIFFVALFVVFSVMRGTQFLSIENFTLVLAQGAHLCFCAAAVTIALIAGQFDLSVGSLAGFSSMFLAVLTAVIGMPLLLALLIVLGCGIAAGLLNGLLVTRARVNAFIVTLGTGSAFGGISLWMSDGAAVYSGIPDGLLSAGSGSIFGVALPVYYVLALLLIGWLLTRRAVMGRYWYALGSNVEAARLAGIKVNRYTVWAFVIGSVFATLAGIVLLARFGSADPNTGAEMLLPAFAASFLGSSISSDGRFVLVGTIVAAFFIALAQNGMELLGLSPGAKPIFNGLVLIAAVALSQQLRRRKAV
jgi:ribose transport system permease protein